jgi:flagellar basal body rod protein FlgG
MWKLIDEEIDLNQLYYPQDGTLEIKVYEPKDEYTQVDVFENDDPYCYTKSGTIYLDENGYIRMVEGLNLITPANADRVITLAKAIGYRVDVSKYTVSFL